MLEDDAEPGAPAPADRWAAWRFWVPRAVLEAALIVLSLLLALWLDDWREQRRIDRDVAETRQAFIEEIGANRAMLRSDDYLAHHRRLQLGLRRALENGPSSDAMADGANALFETGIHFPAFRDAVWRTAAASGVLQHMDRAEVFALADVYGAQEALVRTGASYYPSALALPGHARDPQAMHGALLGTLLYLGDLTAGEETILASHDQALAVLDAADD